MLSSACLPGLEEVAKAAPGKNRIFQLYVRGDRSFVDDFARRAIAANAASATLLDDYDQDGVADLVVGQGAAQVDGSDESGGCDLRLDQSVPDQPLIWNVRRYRCRGSTP